MPHRSIIAAVLAMFAVAVLLQSNDLLKAGLVCLGVYLCALFFKNGWRLLFTLDDAIAPFFTRLGKMLPATLLASAFLSWLLGSRDWTIGALTGLALYALIKVLNKLEILPYELRRKRELAEMPDYSLEGDELRMEGKKTQTIETKKLEEVERILVMTTDQGPFVCDRFLILRFKDNSAWDIPMDNPGYRNFYAALGESLPLDDEQAFLAAFSTGNAVFNLWQDDMPGERPQAGRP